MQVTMTVYKSRRNRNSHIKSVIQVVLIFLFAFVSSSILISVKKKNLMFEERFFYLVSVASDGKESLLEPQKELMKNLGGANVVYKRNDIYHLIACIYLELDSAEEISKNLKSYFVDVKIIKLKSKKVGGKSVKNIRESLGSEKLIKTLYGYTKDFQDLHMNYLAGKCTESQFLNDLVRRKLELEKINSQIEISGEYVENIKTFGQMFSLKLTNFLSGLDVSRSKKNYICNYFVGFYLDFLDFYESL